MLATAYNRGQVLYRIAEVMEGRREQFIADVVDAEGGEESAAAAQVDAAIDRWVWYAGWADKLGQVLGSANAVSGPYFNFSVAEPSGVVAAVAPQGSSLLGLVSVIAPIIVSGNSAGRGQHGSTDPRDLPHRGAGDERRARRES